MTLTGFRGEILSLSHDPAEAPDALRHEADGLLVVDGGRQRGQRGAND